MAGTRAGAAKAQRTIKEKYGKGFYAEIGRKGGQNGHTGGFAANPELAKEAGRKGGKMIKEKYGKGFYAEIGRKGGQNGHTGGFAANPELAKEAGRKGGKISKRGKAKK